MSTFVVFKCDGWWHSFPCSGLISLPPYDADMAWPDAQAQGWTDDADEEITADNIDKGTGLHQYCPAHSRQRART